MNDEEKIYSLMSVAQDQQKLTTELIDIQREEIAQLKKERERTNTSHINYLSRLDKSFKEKLDEVESKFEQKLNYTYFVVTMISCLAMALIVLVGISFYGKYLTNKVIEADAAYTQLEKYNADFSTCSGEPCVRVMVSKGGYGNSGDYFILDPK